MADFAEAIGVLKDLAWKIRNESEDAFLHRAEEYDRAAAVLEAVGAITETDWMALSWIPSRSPAVPKFAALREAAEGE